MGKKKTHDEYLNEIFKLVGDEYSILENYVNTGEKLMTRHNRCGNEYPVSPNKFLYGRRCPRCSQAEGNLKQRRTHKQFVEEVFELVGDEFIVLGTYVKSHDKIQFKHNTCGRLFDMKPSNFLFGQRCKPCSDAKARLGQTLTTEQFKEDIFNLVGGEYTVIGKYYNNRTDITMRHNDCGYEYSVEPSNFKGGRRCPKCSNKIHRTHSMYIEDIRELVGDEYTILGEFRVTKDTVLTRHNVCGYEWESIPSNFLYGKRCPKCAGNLKKTHQEFIEEVFELVGVEYEVLSKYKTSKDKVMMRHNTCGDEFPVTPSHFTSATTPTRCPRCMLIQRGESRMKTTEEVIEELRVIYGDEYTVLGEYKGSKERILVRHNPCGEEFEKTPNAIIRRNCKKCSDLGQMKTNEQYLNDIYEAVGDEYTPLEEYRGIFEKVKMRHNKCGHIWDSQPHKFINGGRRCPKCNESRGETAIRRFLESNNVNFSTQFRIEECRLKRVLPFDFAILDGDNLLMLVEYDGEQHYKPVEAFGGEHGFLEAQLRDQVKTEYCERNNIRLIRIPYWDYNNIESILKDVLGLVETA